MIFKIISFNEKGNECLKLENDEEALVWFYKAINLDEKNIAKVLAKDLSKISSLQEIGKFEA